MKHGFDDPRTWCDKTPTAVPTSAIDQIENLKTLEELLDSGALTQDEFETLKAEPLQRRR